MAEEPYLFGTEDAEITRLRGQHLAWVNEMRALVGRARFGTGDTLLDMGSGPGFTTIELAAVVGPTGRVIARDESERFIDLVGRESRQRELTWVEPSLGKMEALSLPPESLDGAYSRWLLSWVPDAGAIVERVARCLRPGGVLALQEYLDWHAMKMIPESEPVARALEACRWSWPASGATIDIGEAIPDLAARAGLTLEHMRPIARMGRPGSPEWAWIGGFLEIYLPKLVSRGLYEAEDLAAFTREWAARTDEARSWLLAPIMCDAILRKPERG